MYGCLVSELPHLPNEEIVRSHLKQDRVSWMTYKARADRALGLDSNLNLIQEEFMRRLNRSLDKLGILMALVEIEVVPEKEELDLSLEAG